MTLSKHTLKRIIRPLVPVGILEHLNQRRYQQDVRRRASRQTAVTSEFKVGGSTFADYQPPIVLVLYWSHVFGVSQGPAQALADGLRSLQCDVSFLDIEDQAAIDAEAASGKHFDIAISVGALPLAKRTSGKPLFEVFGDLFFVWGLDSIINDLARVWAMQTYFEAARRSSRLRFLFPDRGYAALVCEALTPAQAQYFPFGGFYDPLPRDGIEHPRMRRLAVVGTIGSELAHVHDGGVEEIIDADSTTSLSRSQRDRLTAALHAAGGPANVTEVTREILGIGVDRLLSWEFLPLLTKLDAYEKRRRRLLVLESLRGIPVDYYGAGWEQFAGDCESFRFFGVIPFAGLSRLFRAYHGVVNFDPNWDHGVHDRVYTALGNGCRVLTNASQALVDIDRPDGSLFVYDTNRPDLGSGADAILSADPMPERDVTLFRRANCWPARMDEFLRSMT